jgi:hypothetical protein
MPKECGAGGGPPPAGKASEEPVEEGGDAECRQRAQKGPKGSGKTHVELLVEEAPVMLEGLDDAREAFEDSQDERCEMATMTWDLRRRLQDPGAKRGEVGEDAVAAAEESLQERLRDRVMLRRIGSCFLQRGEKIIALGDGQEEKTEDSRCMLPPGQAEIRKQ